MILRASRAIKLGIPEHVIYLWFTMWNNKRLTWLVSFAETHPQGILILSVSLLITNAFSFFLRYFSRLTTQIPLMYMYFAAGDKKNRLITPNKFFYRLINNIWPVFKKEPSMGDIRNYDKEKRSQMFQVAQTNRSDIAWRRWKIICVDHPRTSSLMEYARINGTRNYSALCKTLL